MIEIKVKGRVVCLEDGCGSTSTSDLIKGYDSVVQRCLHVMAVELGLGSTQFQSLGLLPVSQQKKMDRNKYYFFFI